LAEKLAAYKASLSKEEVEKLIADTEVLKAYQEAEETKEALESIPLLKLSDVDPDPKPLKNELREIMGVPVLFHAIPTSGIGYLEARFPLSGLTLEEMHLAALLRDLYTQVDTEAHSYQELGDEISFETGGIGAGTNVYLKTETYEAVPDFSITARYLYDHTEGTVKLIREVFGQSKFEDMDRVKEILDGLVSNGQEGLVSSGHTTAVKALFAKEKKGAWLENELNGLGCFRYYSALKTQFAERKETLAAALKQVAEKIFAREKMVLSFTGDEAGYALLKEALPAWLSTMKEIAAPTVDVPFVPEKENVGIKTSSMVQYTAMGGNFRDFGFDYTGAFRVFTILMHYEYLWMNIRVKGGAYGCMTRVTRSGNFAMVSYRDPHLKNTLEVFRGVADYLDSLDLSDRDMLKYILGTIGEEDMPQTPATEGANALSAWLSGLTDEDFAKTRHEILNCKVEDLRALAPVLRKVLAENRYLTVGSEGKIDENRDIFDAVETLQGERK
ncbi:MAG: insulinase family protein, partial [Lachnospiraceae bacterium]|nr:insulinase family protein [Lachnospiraceae bacterium]